MRAVTLTEPGAPEMLRLGEVERPTRVNAEFLIRVVAAGVNPIDAKTRAGRGAWPGVTSTPVVLGNDFSGVVVEAPYEAHPLQPGTEVYGMGMVPRMGGAYAEYLTVPALSVARKPPSLSHVEAAGVPLRRSPRGAWSSRRRRRTRGSGCSSTRARAASATSRCSSPPTSAPT